MLLCSEICLLLFAEMKSNRAQESICGSIGETPEVSELPKMQSTAGNLVFSSSAMGLLMDGCYINGNTSDHCLIV